MNNKKRRIRTKFQEKTAHGSALFGLDKILLILTAVLTVLGMLFVADVSAPQAQAYFKDSFFFVKQQLVWGALGIVALIVASKLHYTFWKKYAYLIFLGSLILLVMVLIPGFGSKLLGARRWINIGPITLQPAEIVKLALAIYLARLADQHRPVTVMLVPILLVAGLIMLEPDLGTTIIVVLIGISQIFIAGLPLMYLAQSLAGGGILGLIVIILSSYRRQRLTHFLEGLKDPLSTSYHVKQILFALGSGGLLGVGLGQSRQKYLFLPEAPTDSVFPIIAEEVGFIIAAAIILLMTVFVLRIMRIAKDAPDKFSQMLAGGIAAWIGGQMFINLGSMVALIPLTGVPLPFFSYGGSSLTMVLLGIGILLNISKYAKNR